uniref:Solute carrier family 2, facilitated glucose transporter member 5 n=1 Tax=Kryptolebias marmoratus TaxID=37003 RepID=A0A3Q3AYE8_KRYMA
NHLTATLLTSILAAVLGSFQIGYHTSNVNAPGKIIEEFFNNTWRARHNQSMSDHSLTLLWSLSVSIKDFGALLGSLGVKYLADSYGRNSILIVNSLSVVGACIMFASKASGLFEVLILGRLVFGLFCGLVMSLNPLYIQEVSPTNLRGAFATLNQVSFVSGTLVGMLQVAGLEMVLGTEDYWAMMLSLSVVPAITQYLVLPFCPESPRFLLINQGEEHKAEALLRLRSTTDKASCELEEIKEEAAHSQSALTISKFFEKRSYRQPIIIILTITLGSQLSGFNAVMNYSTRIFQAKFDNAKYLTLGVGAVNVLFTLVAFFLMERVGRRKLLLTGFISIAMSNLLMTIVDYFLHLVPELRSLQVLLVFCVVSAYELGPGPISWFLAAELFDQPGRPIAMAFTSMLNWGGKFVLALLFPPLLKICGPCVYLIFMAMALLTFILTWMRLPETRGRTFDDIAEEFRGAEEIPLHNSTGFNTFI